MRISDLQFREVLGKGAMKTVYRAFDEVLAMEVAWNQVNLNDVFRSPEDLQRLYSEVHLLKNLNHESIIRFYASWIDIDRRTFNFITEMFTSGTLREYRKRYPRVDMRAVKNWSRQILHGLAYLHGHDPPVIHRDLKCDNIFVNGHLGQVKIGDLGLAAILRGSQHAHSVIGTPEFMAPELYEEDYNELVDVYSFGMCVLEMLTSDYPYCECSNPAQIYKKVTSGKLPEAFYKIQDKEARRFVGKCLENVSKRLPAHELLLDPFLASDEENLLSIPKHHLSQKLVPNGTVAELVPSVEADDHTRTTDMSITGTMDPEDDTIFLKVQITDKEGHARNIYFPFDIVNDTTIDVALEMVKELEITDWEPLEIAEMIEEEISSLVPTWKDWGSSQVHHQHSFKYEDDHDDDDHNNDVHHPFYATSSRSSSQVSLSAFLSSYETQSCRGKNIASSPNWPQDAFSNDDASSSCSMNSFKYSSMNYEDEFDLSLQAEHPCIPKTLKSTRFCPSDNTNAYNYKQCDSQLDSWRSCHINGQRKLTKIRSLLDIRSQLLHRSVMAQINKRRLFKTIGAMENIGFQEPGEASSGKKGPSSSLNGWF
ncbi:hypothetical protein PTKIN_Ptkin09bG0290600 [Pterospermum kingtungense]